MADLKGKVALITGGARGIGKSIGERLAKDGADIAVCDVNLEGSQETADELSKLGITARAYQMNVTDVDSVQKAVADCLADFGKIDILVNNAGITRDALMMRMKQDDWDAVIAVNLTGSYNATKAVIRSMMKARYGRIVNMASVVGVVGNAGQANYSASKAGLIGLTKTMAKELATRGITVNAIAPGFIQTEMTDHMTEEAKEAFLTAIPMNRPGSADDVANVTAFLASDDAAYVTGQVICVDGGMVM